jgi:hypothetical protein
MDSLPLPTELIEEQLRRMLDSKTFSGGHHRQLLEFLVKRALAGNDKSLDEYAIATELKWRKANFSPTEDPIVRAEATRLRAKLKTFYSNEGSKFPILIDLPKRAYQINFSRRDIGDTSILPSRAVQPALETRSTSEDIRTENNSYGYPKGVDAWDPPGAGPLLLGVSGAFGAMVGLALLVEVAYQWPKYSTWTLPTAVASGVSSALVTLLILARIRRQAHAGTPLSLAVAVAVLFCWSTAVSFIVAPALPDEPLVLATEQTMSAKVGWIKSVGEALFLPMLALVPLQTIFVLAREVQMGRLDDVRNLLQQRRRAIPPAGAHCVAPLLAFAIFLLVVVSWILANAKLFASLKNGQYYGLFLALDFARAASGLLTLLWVLLYYLTSLSHLKRVAAGRR